MKIVNSDISMASQHSLTKISTKKETISQFQIPSFSSGLMTGNFRPIEKTGPSYYMDLSALRSPFKVMKSDPSKEVDLTKPTNLNDEKMQILERMLTLLTGKTFRFTPVPNLTGQASTNGSNPTVPVQTAQLSPAIGAAGLVFQYQRQQSYHETEQLNFSAQGVFKTADGKEINFDTDMNLSRDFATSNNINLSSGPMIDPLVINYNGPAADLTNTKFSFDLNNDGKDEQISSLKEGSGFLALDSNGDGKVDNGSELFGATTGNGFSELGKYDQDHNGWIDENDPIYNKLQIWTKDSNGKDQLFALGQKGIGAIYLGNTEAAFSINNSSNQQLGESQKAGLFARDNGTVGTMQEVDLVV